MFRSDISSPSSELKHESNMKLSVCYSLYAGLLSHSSILKVITKCFTDNSFNFQRTIQSYIPEETNLHNHLCENLRSYIHYICYPCLNLTSSALTRWLQLASELYRPSDSPLSGKLVPTFADGECRVVSVTDPYGRILGYLCTGAATFPFK
jgi:hypothetical protein